MPLYRFSGLVSHVYPETRDALNHPLGLVEPGDEREFEQPPDHLWVPAGDGSGGDGGEGTEPSGDSAAGNQDGTGEETAPPAQPETPAGPVPAPPAVIPGA
jgi:hypothetical protein